MNPLLTVIENEFSFVLGNDEVINTGINENEFDELISKLNEYEAIIGERGIQDILSDTEYVKTKIERNGGYFLL